MDADPVDLGLVLREAVQPRFPRAPVVFVRPVLADVLDVGEGNTLRPVVDALALGKTRRAQATPKIVELGVACVDGERLDAPHYFGCGTIRRYGFGAFQPFG